jgi:SAM-dependent methyltransferase/glycosyltransferase involved in cell wall biosynthesis
MNDKISDESGLAWTGERYVPWVGGSIELEHLHRYAIAALLVRGKRVLDVASGEGYGSDLLALNARSVIGVDIAEEAVAHARSRYRRPNLEYRVGSAAEIPLPEASVDAVVSFETIEHHDRHEGMMAEIRRVLAPGGLLVISSPNRRYYSIVPRYTNPYHLKELFTDEFERLLRDHFSHVRLFGQRVVFGSLIVTQCEGAGPFCSLMRGAEQTGLSRPVYDLALASDAMLPELSGSLFETSNEESDPIAELQRAIGARAEQAVRIASLEQRMVLQAAQLAAARRSIATRDDQIRTLNQRISAHEKAVALRSRDAPGRFATHVPLLRGRRLRALAERVRGSELFDAEYYLRTHADVRASGVDAAMHYLTQGWKEGRDPSAAFSTSEYLARHPQAARAGVNPLVHYLDRHAVAARGPDAPENATAAPETVRALVVDDQLPARDRDAGSLRICDVIEILLALGYEVTLAPFTMQRVERDAAFLEHLGVRCLARPEVPSLEAHLASEGRGYALIYSSRPDPTEALMPHYRRHAPQARVLYDTQDLHFVREGRFAALAGDEKQRATAAATARRRQELALVDAADCTLVVSETEREVLAGERPNACLQVLPLMHELYPSPAPFEARRDLVFLGNYRHQPNVDAVESFVQEILPLVRASLPEVRLVVAGGSPAESLLALGGPGVTVTGHVADLAGVMNACRVAVNPLRFGAGVKGKILTAMAYGLPGVGTPLAAEGMQLRDGENFLIADDPEAFAAAVVRLYTDERLWARLSANGRAFLVAHHGIGAGVAALRRVHERLGLAVPAFGPPAGV